jgi:hypothetical protein
VLDIADDLDEQIAGLCAVLIKKAGDERHEEESASGEREQIKEPAEGE